VLAGERRDRRRDVSVTKAEFEAPRMTDATRYPPSKRHGCASCAVPREVVERKRKATKATKARGKAAGKGGDAPSQDVLLLFGGEMGKKGKEQRIFSDVWMFDPDTLECSFLGEAPSSFTHRSYFTATYVDGAVWLVGGKTQDDIVSGDTVWKYVVREASWELVDVEGDDGLTRRTAHGACLSPWDGQTVVVFGGYALRERRGAWMSDVFEIDTREDASHLSRSPRISFQKVYADTFARAYMSLDAIGGVCVALFGRQGSKTVRESLVYDKKRELKVIKTSTKPVPRYNHRTSTRSDGSLMACGGDMEGTVALVRYDAKKKILHMETEQVGVRKSHCQLVVDGVERAGAGGKDAVKRGTVTRLSLVGGYDLGPGEPEVDQLEVFCGGDGGRLVVSRDRVCRGGSAVIAAGHGGRHAVVDAGRLEDTKRLLEDKERELDERTRALEQKTSALEEAQGVVKDQNATIAGLEEELSKNRHDINRLNRELQEKDRELDEMAAACTEERARVDQKAREVEEMEQQRDLQALQFNSELERIHGEYKVDLRNKDEQMREIERGAASAAAEVRCWW